MGKRAILIAGPTASGKSALALDLASKLGGKIINADALQVYDGYRVLTARPNEDDTKQAEHVLYGHVPFESAYSVGAWLNDIKPHLDGKPPIIVGGTGLYFHALTQGLVDIPATKPTVREEAEKHLAHDGAAFFIEYLKTYDPKILTRIDINNPRRLQRAFEVHRSTGRALSQWQDVTPPGVLALGDCVPIVLTPPRDWLRERITKRFHAMMNEGAIDEVASHLPFNEKIQANQALGAKEIAGHLNGILSREDATNQAITATHQYAKRQQSWFRSRMQTWHSLNPALWQTFAERYQFDIDEIINMFTDKSL